MIGRWVAILTAIWSAGCSTQQPAPLCDPNQERITCGEPGSDAGAVCCRHWKDACIASRGDGGPSCCPLDDTFGHAACPFSAPEACCDLKTTVCARLANPPPGTTGFTCCPLTQYCGETKCCNPGAYCNYDSGTCECVDGGCGL